MLAYFLVIVLAVIVVVLVKRYRKKSYDIISKNNTTSVKPLPAESADQETDHQNVFQNPTYQCNVTTLSRSTDTVKSTDEETKF